MSNSDDQKFNKNQEQHKVVEKELEINDKDRKNLKKLLEMIDNFLNVLEEVDPKVLRNNPIAKKSIIHYLLKIYKQYQKLGDKLGPVLGDLLETKVHEFLFEVTKPHTEITPEYLINTAKEIFPLVSHRIEFILSKTEDTQSKFEAKLKKLKDLEEIFEREMSESNENNDSKSKTSDDLRYAERESNEDNFSSAADEDVEDQE